MLSEADAQFEDFIRIDHALREIGLAAPTILAKGDGLLLLEDLGPENAARFLETSPDEEVKIYGETARALIKLQAVLPIEGLPRLDAVAARDLCLLFREWCAPDLDPHAFTLLERAWSDLPPMREVTSLRDLHAENIVWRPQLAGTDRIGLLDFQDAVITHPLYDIVSLLRDARRDVGQEAVHAVTEIFLVETGMSKAQFDQAFAVISAQRALRILGIFARLEKRDGKTKYRAFVPRMVHYLRQDLEHKSLSDLAALIEPELVQYD